MTELYFLRHGLRIDNHLNADPNAKPILENYQPYDVSLSIGAESQVDQVVEDILESTQAFDEDDDDSTTTKRKNIYIHFSPYLRCCQTADLLMSQLKTKLAEIYKNYKIRFQLLGDFALSEWVHKEMKHQESLIDAYNFYIPNLKTLKNKNACSNFRPTTTLGPYNGPGLSYKDYQQRCKDYFKKLLATYDKPTFIKNKDIIIVVSHGYTINNFMSFFLNHPIFEEIPEGKLNFAKRVMKDEVENDDEFNPNNYTWKLCKDALGVANEDLDTGLNLETDIVYYKTNFVKKAEIANPASVKTEQDDKPRASFKIKSTSASNKGAENTGRGPPRHNYLCSAARDWLPNQKHFEIKTEFKEKIINDESFRKAYSITNRPSKPISPTVSPNSAPSGSNSVIDLSKILTNEDITPMKLKYSNTSEIPIHKINSRVNSQVNLAAYNRINSNDNSLVDLPRYVQELQHQNRVRSNSNPNAQVVVAHSSKDSYFPSAITKVRSSGSDVSIDSIQSEDLDTKMDPIEERFEPNHIRNSPIDTLNRARSLNKRKTNNPLLLSYQQKRSAQNVPTVPSSLTNSTTSIPKIPQKKSKNNITDSENEMDNDNDSESEGDSVEDNNHQKLFSLLFDAKTSSPPPNSSLPISRGNRSRKNSIKYVSGLDQGIEKAKRPVFYNFESDDSSSGEDEEYEEKLSSTRMNKSTSSNSTNERYNWFGQNR